MMSEGVDGGTRPLPIVLALQHDGKYNIQPQNTDTGRWRREEELKINLKIESSSKYRRRITNV